MRTTTTTLSMARHCLLWRHWLLMALAMGAALLLQAQPASQPAVADLVAAQSFSFEPNLMRPAKGRQIALSPGHYLQVGKDTVASALPYMGEMYQAPMDRDQAGMDFTSTDFTYKVTERKKGGWEIEIKPKDVRRVNSLRLTVYKDGTASLDINANDRAPISYQGLLKPLP